MKIRLSPRYGRRDDHQRVKGSINQTLESRESFHQRYSNIFIFNEFPFGANLLNDIDDRRCTKDRPFSPLEPKNDERREEKRERVAESPRKFAKK